MKPPRPNTLKKPAESPVRANLARSNDNPFWRFSLAIYALPEVSNWCLRLQDQYQLDVNLLLYTVWRGSRGESLGAGQLAQLESAVAAWRSQVLLPIRALRRQLKGIAEVEPTREQLLQVELSAEQQQQNKMYALDIGATVSLPVVPALQQNLQTLWLNQRLPNELLASAGSDLAAAMASLDGEPFGNDP